LGQSANLLAENRRLVCGWPHLELHVPPERYESFWSDVADCLKPTGPVFFADDAHRTAEELVYSESSSFVRRQLNDGTPYRVVKVLHEPKALERRLQQLGWG
jgi:hypothetical protein